MNNRNFFLVTAGIAMAVVLSGLLVLMHYEKTEAIENAVSTATANIMAAVTNLPSWDTNFNAAGSVWQKMDSVKDSLKTCQDISGYPPEDLPTFRAEFRDINKAASQGTSALKEVGPEIGQIKKHLGDVQTRMQYIDASKGQIADQLTHLTEQLTKGWTASSPNSLISLITAVGGFAASVSPIIIAWRSEKRQRLRLQTQLGIPSKKKKH